MEYFDLLVRKLYISNKHALMEALSEEWLQISSGITKTLVQSMPIRLQAVIEANGMHTKH